MALFQKLSHSFSTTFFYLWTVIQALLSLHSPSPFPFRETSIIVPYTIDVDLERGATRHDAPSGAASSSTELPTPSRNAVQKAIREDARRQQGLRCSPAFASSSAPAERELTTGDTLDTDLSAASGKALFVEDDKCVIEDTSIPRETYHFSSTVSATPPSPDAHDFSADPFLEKSGFSPFSFVPGIDYSPENDAEAKRLIYPFLTSTPSRACKDRRGHRRAALATITTIEHVTPETAAGLPSSSTDALLVSTPVAQRMRSPSLRRKPGYDDLHSLSPTRPSPKKRPASVNWFAAPAKSVSPLRIAKRNVAPVSDKPVMATFESTLDEDELQDMISTVRAAFVDLWADDSQEDAGVAARELINRQSVWTCDAVSMDDTDTSENDSEEEEYGNELKIRSPCSPPPPYAFSNSPFYALHPIGQENKGSMDVKLPSVCSIPASDSTELSYLQESTPASSVDSCLDDILTSFEHLVTTMGPKFSSHPTASATALAVGYFAYDGVVEEYGTQWSDILELDSY